MNSQKSSVQVKNVNKGEKPVIKAKGSGGNKKTANNKFAVPEKVLKYLRIVLLIAVLVVVFYPPFLRGLYFEDEQLPTEIFVFAVFIIFWVYKLLKRDKRFLETPIDYASLGFVIVYLASIFVSVSLRLAIAEWLKYCMYFAVFFMLSELVDTYKSKIATLWVIVASGTGVAFIGIDGVAGEHIAKICNGIFKVLGLKIEFFETFLAGRIYSTLQYPNTLGAYLAAIFFITLGLMITSSKLWARLIAAAAGFVVLLTFVFTLSRGAFIVMGVAAIILLLILPNGSRVKGILFGLSTLIPVGFVSLKFYGYVQNPAGNARRIWLAVLIGIVITAVLTALAGYAVKWLEKISWKVYLGIISVVLVVIVTCVIVIFTASVPLELSHSATQPDGQISTQKNVILKPGKEYKLIFDVNANDAGNKQNAYSIQIFNNTEKSILFGRDIQQLASMEGKATNGTEQKGISFKVSTESKIINIAFTNTYQGTKAVFDKAKIIDSASGKTVKGLILKYKYLPQFLVSMFDNLQVNNSTVTRSIFYKDGFKIVKDHWLIGAGGGAWSLLYYSYQSYQYWSSQAHNYILQLGIECGVIGWIILMLLAVPILLMFILEYRNKRENDVRERILQSVLFTAIAAMIAHSVIDFDFSLSAVFLLLWELIALFNSRHRSKTNVEIIKYKITFINKVLEKLDALKKVRYLKLYPVVGFVVTAAIIIYPILLTSAKGYAAQAAKVPPTQKGREAAAEYMRKAASTDMFNPEYKLNYANLLKDKPNLTQKEMDMANSYAAEAFKLAKYDYEYYIGKDRVNILPRIIQYYFSVGDIENGLRAADRVVELSPLLPVKWQVKANTYFEIIKYYLQNNNTYALKYTDKILAIIDEAKAVNRKNMNPFKFTDETYDMIEKARYVKDSLQNNGVGNINKAVFYSIPDMDINLDNKPDQWSVSNNADYINISSKNGVVKLENISPDKEGYVQSRSLYFQPGKKYRLEVELANNSGIGSIPYSISGISSKVEELKPSGSVLEAEFETPGDFKPNSNILYLGVKGKYEIRNITIVEK